MADKTAATKMRIRPGMRVAILHPDRDAVEALGLPDDTTVGDSTDRADAVLLFVTAQTELEERLPEAVRAVDSATMLWVIYPKGSKAAGLDISRDTIWLLAESLGMRPVGMVSVNETWSGFRLRVGA